MVFCAGCLADDLFENGLPAMNNRRKPLIEKELTFDKIKAAQYFTMVGVGWHAILILCFGLGIIIGLVYYLLIAPWLSPAQAEGERYRQNPWKENPRPYQRRRPKKNSPNSQAATDATMIINGLLMPKKA